MGKITNAIGHVHLKLWNWSQLIILSRSSSPLGQGQRSAHEKTMSAFASRYAIPLGIALMGAQASLVSVYGGQRAIIFDRFQGVKPEVGHLHPLPLHGSRTMY